MGTQLPAEDCALFMVRRTLVWEAPVLLSGSLVSFSPVSAPQPDASSQGHYFLESVF